MAASAVPSTPPAPATPRQHTSVNEFLTMQAAADEDFIMSVRCSDLPADAVLELQAFIDQRMTKGAVYAGAGQTAPLDRGTVCFYCLLRPDAPAEPPAATATGETPPYYSQEYIACFVHRCDPAEADDLDLFKPELDAFCRALHPLLFAPDAAAGSSDDALVTHIAQWQTVCLDYVPRVLRRLGDALQALLCAVLQGRSVLFDTPADVALDAAKFCEAASILSLMQTSDASAPERDLAAVYRQIEPGEGTALAAALLPLEPPQDVLPSEAAELEQLMQTWRRPLRLTLDTDTCRLEGCDPDDVLHSHFCEAWAGKLYATYVTIEQLNAADQTSYTYPSLHLRRLLETYKTKAIQELTMVRRMVRKAEVDHYAHFSCFRQLEEHNNRDVLLLLMLRETTLLQPSAETRQVLLLIRELLRTGATRPRTLARLPVR